MSTEVMALVGALSALITNRLVNLLKLPVKRLMYGETSEAEEGRKAVVQGLALVVGGVTVWLVSMGAMWLIGKFGEDAFNAILSVTIAALGAEGLYIAKK